MDTPGLDVESVTGMVGGGAQVVVFTTGLGTPTGNPIAPVIKITGNARTARQMADNIDLDVSGIMDDSETLDAAADRLFAEVLAVAPGSRPPPSGSATASSRFIVAIPRFEGLSPMQNAALPATSPSVAGAHRPLPLGDLRAAVLRRDDQLRRPAGHRHPQADAPGGVRLERDRLRRHRLRVPARLRDRVPARRADDRPARHEEGLHRRARRVEPGGDGARRSHGVWPGRRRDARSSSGSPIRRRWPDSSSRGSRSGSARRATFPAAIKIVAEWFPKKERALATGIFNSGTNIGALRDAARRAVDHVRTGAGTGRSSSPGALGLPVAVLLVPLYRRARGPPVGRRRPSWRYIRSDPPDPPARIPWLHAAAATGRRGRLRSASS